MLPELHRPRPLARPPVQARPVDQAALVPAHQVRQPRRRHAVAPDLGADGREREQGAQEGRVGCGGRGHPVHGWGGGFRGRGAEVGQVGLEVDGGGGAAGAAGGWVQGADVGFVHDEEVGEVLEGGEVEARVLEVGGSRGGGEADVDVEAAVVGDEGAVVVGVGAF